MQIYTDILTFVALILISLSRRKPAKAPMRAFPVWLPAALRRPAAAYALIGLLAFGGSALMAAVTGMPQPRIHDEFSYLLAADTFAQGRLTNPPHPLWRHFETFHVIQQPTYASKYPPAQGLMLACGQVSCGLPSAGVWLSAGLAAAAICWMLAGWCPLSWAWLGGLVAAVRLVFSGPAFAGEWETIASWSQSYWGGSVAALGGALIFGSLPRIMKRQRLRDALWLALGLAILANSRPFEGLVVSIPVMVVLGLWLVRAGHLSWLHRCRRVALPVALGLLLAAGWMGYYNFRVTGDPFLLPYQVHEATYGLVPTFFWQALRPEPQYLHQSMKDFHADWALDYYLSQQTFSGWLRMAIWKVVSLWVYFIGILFTPFLLVAWPKMWRRRRVKFALGVWALLLAALLAETWKSWPHYAAPAMPLAILLIVESLRQARLCRWRGRPVGRTLVGAVLPLLLLSSITSFALAQHYKISGWHQDRARLLRDLETTPGRHLVMVRYGPEHSPHEQWIYNEADLDGAKVVWAWEMGPQEDRELFDYYQDRRVWLLQADLKPRFLRPYPGRQMGESGAPKEPGGAS